MLGSRFTRVLATCAVAVTAAGLTSTAALAATRAPATPPAFNTGQINIRGACLSDTSDSTTPGNPVRVEPCASHSAQEWTLDTDGTIRVNGHAGQGCLGLSSSGTAQIVGCGDLSAQWFPQADKELVNVNLSTPQAKSCLYAPSGKAGSSLVKHQCGATFAGLEFTIPNTRYAASSLTYRPDSGGAGTSWALDTMTRDASVGWPAIVGEKPGCDLNMIVIVCHEGEARLFRPTAGRPDVLVTFVLLRREGHPLAAGDAGPDVERARACCDLFVTTSDRDYVSELIDNLAS